MGQEGCEATRQTALNFRCKKLLTDAGKSSDSTASATLENTADEKQDITTHLASPTPEKKVQPPRNARKQNIRNNNNEETKGTTEITKVVETMGDNSTNCDSRVPPFVTEEELDNDNALPETKMIEIPEKYKATVEFFDRMVCSIRLLRLRKKLSSFRNISTQVEIMAKRKFNYRHLAQIKYLLSEIVLIERIRVKDEKSMCMVPELKIDLSLDAVACLLQHNQASSLVLHKAFCAKLLDFHNADPEASSIPEATLPAPFNQPCKFEEQNPWHDESSEESFEQTSDVDVLARASHFSSSAKNVFSKMCLIPEAQRTELPALVSPITICRNKGKDREFNDPLQNDSSCSTTNINTKSPTERFSSSVYENTPVKNEPALCQLTVETPALQTPKLSSIDCSPCEKSETEMETPSSSARRSLAFSPTKIVENAMDPDVCLNQQAAVMSSRQKTMTTKGSFTGEETSGVITGSLEMELDEVSHRGDLGKNQNCFKSQEAQSNRAGLFNTIRIIFQAITGNSITKQELMHKILSYNYEIEETSEIEEQLELLEKLAPDWICGRAASTGDFLYTIQKSYDQEYIHAKIMEAI